MSQHFSNTTVTSFAGIDGDLQLVVETGELILLDAQGCERGCDGVLRHNHGTVRLTYQVACELRDFLGQIEEPSDVRQPRLWGEATFTHPVGRLPVRSHHRRAA